MRFCLFVFVLISPGLLFAGMPMITLNEAASMRVEAISFFLVVILLVAWGIKAIWNRLGQDFERLPRLSYKGSLALTLLWGLLFVLILTMISGARELMTPGAWEKRGSTYSLASNTDEQLDQARHSRLEALRALLWRYASEHDGELPAHDLGPDIPPSMWQSIGDPGLRYIYVPGATIDAGRRPVIYEPGDQGAKRLVLYSDGSISKKSISEIAGDLRKARQ